MNISKEILKRPFWALTPKETLSALGTTEAGLISEEVLNRQKVFGKNEIAKGKRLTRTRIFFSQFANPLIILLIIASGITVAIGSFKDAIFIGAAAFLNVLMGFYQENKAEAALSKLRGYIEERVRVFRNGREIELDAAELVPGDVVHLTQGGRVPADCRLIYENDLTIEEAMLTGESLPVRKGLVPVMEAASLGDRRSMVFRGTLVTEGFGNAVVVHTGKQTELGKIATLIAEDHTDQSTPLRRAISAFSTKITIFLVIFTLLLFALGVARGTPIFEMFLTSVAVIVSAVPEGLPIAITVILAIGVQRLAREQGIVRKLLAAETLGNTSIVLTDKTGTLTEAKIELTNINLNNAVTEAGPKFAETDFLAHALTNTDAVVENPEDHWRAWRVVGRPLEQSLISGAAAKGVLLPEIKKASELLNYLPFTSENKYSAAIVKKDGQLFLNILGAPEIVLNLCVLPAADREIWQTKINKMARSGERVLGLAVLPLRHSDEVFLKKPETYKKAVFWGTASFRDPVRSGVKEAIQEIQAAGVRTVIVTGDHRGTAEAVAEELGFTLSESSVIEGRALSALSDEALSERLPKLQVIARVSPEDKVRIARVFKSRGEIVAMTGDGVNDAASLKEADIGVAMGSGTDIAKDVADLVLLNDNFETIVSAIREGRKIMQNMKKVIVYLLANVFNELFLIGGALLLALPAPINALQILWVNLVSDSFPAISLAFEDHVDYLKERQRHFMKGLLDGQMKLIIFGVGAITSLLLIGAYVWLLHLGFSEITVRTFIFTALGTNTLFILFSIRNLKKSIFAHNPFSNRYLLGSLLLGFVLMGLAVYHPSLQAFMGTVSLPASWLIGVVAFGMLNIVAVEVGKLIYRRRELRAL